MSARVKALPQELFERYDFMLQRLTSDISCLPEPGTDPAHLRWMLREMRNFTDAGKSGRWLGFIQALIIQHGLTTVTAERDFTRPFFSAPAPSTLVSVLKPLDWKAMPNCGRTNFVAESILGKWEFWECPDTGKIYVCPAGEHQGRVFEGSSQDARAYLEGAYIKRIRAALATTEGK